MHALLRSSGCLSDASHLFETTKERWKTPTLAYVYTSTSALDRSINPVLYSNLKYHVSVEPDNGRCFGDAKLTGTYVAVHVGLALSAAVASSIFKFRASYRNHQRTCERSIAWDVKVKGSTPLVPVLEKQSSSAMRFWSLHVLCLSPGYIPSDLTHRVHAVVALSLTRKI